MSCFLIISNAVRAQPYCPESPSLCSPTAFLVAGTNKCKQWRVSWRGLSNAIAQLQLYFPSGWFSDPFHKLVILAMPLNPTARTLSEPRDQTPSNSSTVYRSGSQPRPQRKTYKVSTELQELYWDLRERGNVDATLLDMLGQMYAFVSALNQILDLLVTPQPSTSWYPPGGNAGPG